MILLLDRVEKDRNRGAIELTAYAINQALKLNKKDIITFSKYVGIIRKEMAPLVNLGKMIKDKSPVEIVNILLELKKKIQDGGKKIIENAKQYIKNKNIISLSYSSTIMDVIKSNKPKKVYWMKSLPGGEGKKSINILKQYNIDVKIIYDSEVARVMDKIDVILSGADAYSRKFIVNKVGTLPLFIVGEYYQKERWVITHSLKKTDKPVINGLLFELIPVKLITGIITDEGIWRQ